MKSLTACTNLPDISSGESNGDSAAEQQGRNIRPCQNKSFNVLHNALTLCKQHLNAVFCGALCRQQRPRVHVPVEGPRGPEAG